MSRGRVPFRGEAGFTLLEVIVSVMLTSLIAVLAYGAAQVSFDARARLGRNLRDVQSERAARQILADALRNAQPPRRADQPGFQLQANRLSFVAAGGAPPLDPDYDWLISIGPAGKNVEFVATPLGHAPSTEVRFSLPRVTRWDVRVLTPRGAAWLGDWPDGTQLPRAVEMSFWNDSAPVGSPLHVTLVP
ncbi:MAG: hypothetical protein QOH59_3056 [Gemmatimonadales bacterium]|nr:hypothetical protein [Gemmatimonadales bacterium]